jgi:hypothetical protein
VLYNRVVVCATNFVGVAAIVFLSGHATMDGGAIGRTYLQIAAAKSSCPSGPLFFAV